MSFARNFAFGQQIAKEALDAYYSARERKRLEDIASAKPEEIQNAYTEEDAERLRAIAEAKDPNGNPYYTLIANQDGSYGIKPNFSYADSSGNSVVSPNAAVATISPRSRALDFLGSRYAPEDLTADKISAIKTRAMADVVSERDPALGLRIRQAADAAERDAVRFSWEQQRFPLEQRAREVQLQTNEIGLRDKQRTEEARKLVDRVYQMPIDAIKIYAGQLNLNTSNLPFLSVGQTKDGYKIIHIDPRTGVPTGKEFALSDDQLKKVAAAYVLSTAGYGPEASAILSEVNKELADIVKDQNKLLIDTAKLHNEVVAKQDTGNYRRAELGLRARQNDRRELREFVDDKGNVVVLDISKLPVGENGVVSLPPGLRPKTARPEIATQDEIELAKALIAQGEPASEALKQARAALRGEVDPMTQRLLEALSRSAEGGDPFAPQPKSGTR